MKNNYLLLLLLFLSFHMVNAQFSLDGEFRPRSEYRHGFGDLISETDDAGYAISTRFRLNAGFTTDAYTFYLSLQDVLVWGENRQLRPEDANNSFSIFQAWAAVDLGSGFSTKIGRQTINYDDQRIMGGVDWAQQARHHDAVLISYKKKKIMIDLGLAFNQDFNNVSGFQPVGTAYNTIGFFSYKTMQYVYLKNNWKYFSGSLLLLNNGFQNFEIDGTTPDGASNLQTLGTHLDYKKGRFGFSANAFLQTGERQNSVDVKGAYLLGLDISFKAFEKVGLEAGIEIISGNDADIGETGAFFPLYGTNHKFNGFMDYFYVGNHTNSIGLFDVHVSAKFKLAEKSSLMIKALNFRGEQALISGDKALGTEIDLVFSQGFKGYNLSLGYSRMFACDGMYELKGISKDAAAKGQNWAWVMLVIKPKFLNTASN